ncbi:hypothetical protein C2G38_2209489 [Gigaspora rosea]|uniref:BTB domain-containing protein n=1 Tax=Gigaspora rosea TaxID=44941 RepID=A0A397UKC2_9GLOM|nr:hypothetical protein C2G38_2209489 [Gigaspora rosea]
MELIGDLQKLLFLSLWYLIDDDIQEEEPKIRVIKFAEILPLTLQYLDLGDSLQPYENFRKEVEAHVTNVALNDTLKRLNTPIHTIPSKIFPHHVPLMQNLPSRMTVLFSTVINEEHAAEIVSLFDDKAIAFVQTKIRLIACGIDTKNHFQKMNKASEIKPTDATYQDFNVIISTGEPSKIVQAHSNALRYRSLYFRNELAKARVILIEDQDASFIFELMLVACEFLLEELVKYLETHLIEMNSNGPRPRFSPYLQNNQKMFISLPENALMSFIKRDDLQMEEKKIWNMSSNEELVKTLVYHPILRTGLM